MHFDWALKESQFNRSELPNYATLTCVYDIGSCVCKKCWLELTVTIFGEIPLLWEKIIKSWAIFEG